MYLRRRLLVAALAILLVFLLVDLGSRAVAGIAAWRATPSSEPVPAVAPPAGRAGASASSDPSVYVVAAGDTLWSIARRLDPDGDPRPIVDRLARQVDGGRLRAGQRLSLDGLP